MDKEIVDKFLEFKCRKALEKLNLHENPIYLSRLAEELDTVSTLGFSNYFLVVEEICRWCWENNIIVGPGRGCLLGRTPVQTPLGYKNLEDIKIGDQVLGQDGNYHTVEQTFNWDSSESLLEFRSFYDDREHPVTCTKDHKILVDQQNLVISKQKIAQGYRYSKPSCSPKWVRANEIRSGDAVVTPIPRREIEDIEWIDLADHIDQELCELDSDQIVEFKKPNGYDRQTYKILPRFIKVDEKFCEFLGLFCGDGWLRSDTQGVVGLCDNSNNLKTRCSSIMTEVFNLHTHKAKHGTKNVNQFFIRSKVVRNLIKNLFSDYQYKSKTKHIPNIILKLPRSKVEAFLKGLWDADGSRKDRLKFTTSSRKLAEQVRFLIWSLGNPATLAVDNRNDPREEFKNRGTYYEVIRARPKKNKNTQSWYVDNKYIYQRIFSIQEIENVSGKVYDLCIPENQSYQTSSFLVHNSAGGSLIFYLLRITALDPVKYDLPFSRFLNRNRVSPPDADIDIPHTERERVIEHIKNTYGSKRVCQISTYGLMKARSAIRDIARVIGKELTLANDVANLIPPPIAGRPIPLKEAVELEPKLKDPKYEDIVQPSLDAEGVIRTRGIHAAGIVIADKDICEYVPVCTDKEGNLVTQLDMGAVDKVGLIKFDFLGLKTLSIIADCVALIKKTRGKEIHPYNIPLDDQKTYDSMCSGDLDGVFQLEGSTAIQQITVAIQPKCLEDISVINALFRPGPIQAGYVNEYIGRRNGTKDITYIDKAVEFILKPTCGLFLYQEQVMKIAQVLAGYTEPEADELRKAIGKKKPELMVKEKDKFLNGSEKIGIISKEVAEKLFSEIEGCADYLFNSSHSLTYSFIGYITGYLKTNYPEEFFVSLLTHNLKSEKVSFYIRKARDRGIQILPPDINNPSLDFIIEEGSIRFGLSATRDLSKNAVAAIIQEHKDNGKFKDLQDFVDRVPDANKKALVALAWSGALDTLVTSPLFRESIVGAAEAISEYKSAKKDYIERLEEIKVREKEIIQAQLEGKTKRLPRPLKEKKLLDFPLLELPEDKENTVNFHLVTQQKLFTDIYIDFHPHELFSAVKLKNFRTHNSLSLQDETHKKFVKICGPVVDVKQANSKKTKQAINSIFIEDEYGIIPITYFGALTKELAEIVEIGKLIEVEGKLTTYTTETDDGETHTTIKITASSIKAIAPQCATLKKYALPKENLSFTWHLESGDIVKFIGLNKENLHVLEEKLSNGV